MSDWRIGDLAVCVADGHWPVFGTDDLPIDPSPVFECIYSVTGICFHSDGALALLLAELPYSECEASGFRKVLPDEQEPCETEFVTLLKRSKRRVVA